MVNRVEIEVREKGLSFETGKMARQADGSVVAQYGDTVILATAVSSKTPREGIDFFPLTIDYQEKTYSAGKIPGGFFKREGRPTEKEVLTSRLIDRPVQAAFPKRVCLRDPGHRKRPFLRGRKHSRPSRDHRDVRCPSYIRHTL